MSLSAKGHGARHYERHKGVALGALRKHCPWLAPDEREAIYHDAFVILLEKDRQGSLEIASMHERQVRSYLLTAAIHRGLRIGASADSKRTRLSDDPAFGLADDGRPLEDRVASASELAALREQVEELPERQRAVIKLRFWLERSPEEIESFLGISHRLYRKEIERAFRRLAARFELVRAGEWCDDRRDLVLAYAAGVAEGEASEQARRHLESCTACKRLAVDLRHLVGRAAALGPLPAVPPAGDALARTGQLLVDAKSQIAQIVGHSKAQAVTLAARTDAAAPLSAVGARPGAAVAVIASCVALGGGATYCAVEAIPRTGHDPGHVTAVQERSAAPQQTPPQASPLNVTAPPPPVSVTAPSAETPPVASAVPSPPAPSQPEHEFTPTPASATPEPQVAAATLASPERGPRPDRQPARPPDGTGGEFAP
jgi:DNA-directed RNA polymerase specialized sigma24 family protein